MENTEFSIIPNKAQYEVGKSVYLEIKKPERAEAERVKISLFTYQGKQPEWRDSAACNGNDFCIRRLPSSFGRGRKYFNRSILPG